MVIGSDDVRPGVWYQGRGVGGTPLVYPCDIPGGTERHAGESTEDFMARDVRCQERTNAAIESQVEDDSYWADLGYRAVDDLADRIFGPDEPRTKPRAPMSTGAKVGIGVGVGLGVLGLGFAIRAATRKRSK